MRQFYIEPFKAERVMDKREILKELNGEKEQEP